MPPIRTHKRSNSFSGNGNGNGNGPSGNIVLPLQTKSKRCISFYEDPEQVKAEQEEEDAAIERATRAFELEAAKSRLLDERDLRDFARGVFRREYRAQKLDRWRKQVNICTKRRSEGGLSCEGNRARSMSPCEVGMTPPEFEEEEKQQKDFGEDDHLMDTDDDENEKPNVQMTKSSGKSKTHYRQRSYNFSATTTPIYEKGRVGGVMQHNTTTKGIADLISIPHAIQRKLLKAMNNICITSAFNFTKKYHLPLTLNIDTPSPKITRLTIHALTDAIIAAYNSGSIPPESVWEDIAFGFVGVFEAAGMLDDAVLYFKMRLSDRRICAVLLAGVDLLQALRDEEGVAKGEAVLCEAERLILLARERVLNEEDGLEDEGWYMDGDADGDDDNEENNVRVDGKEVRELNGVDGDVKMEINGNGGVDGRGNGEMCVESDEDR